MCKVLFLTGLDPWAEPGGGTSTFAKHMLMAYGSKLAISSYCNEDLPVGEWIKRDYKNEKVNFFNRGPYLNSAHRKPIIPNRIKTYMNAKKWLKKIYTIRIYNLFTDSPELLFVTQKFRWDSVCYSFAGLSNPVSNARYAWARLLGSIFETRMLKTLNEISPDAMIAAADNETIDHFLKRTGNLIDGKKLHQFPTRVDTSCFFPQEKNSLRNELGIPKNRLIIAVVGRLCWVKGWDLLIYALSSLKLKIKDVFIYFIGDGEDRAKIIEKAEELGLSDNILITGFLPQSEVVKHINASDLCAVGSYREGWSIAMCEALACGKALVTTNISGAHDMVQNGKNGYIIESRNPEKYAAAIQNALKLPHAKEHSLKISKRFSLDKMAEDMGSIWSPLRVEKNLCIKQTNR